MHRSSTVQENGWRIEMVDGRTCGVRIWMESLGMGGGFEEGLGEWDGRGEAEKDRWSSDEAEEPKDDDGKATRRSLSALQFILEACARYEMRPTVGC
jgi:hypothetical protein